MKPTLWVSILLNAALTTAFAAREASEAGLGIHSPAPKLQAGKWVRGEPVTEFQRGQAYLIVFWATWSPWNPTLLRLSEIHEQYKDKGLVVIGLNCWEREEGQVEPFLRQFGDRLSFRIALDDQTDSRFGKMVETWVIPAGFKRINLPQAFLVDTKGVIAWIGSVERPPDSVIRAVLEGTFDTQQAAEKAAAEAKQKAEASAKRAREAAQKVTVKVGAPAPKLQSGRWVQGEPLTELQKGRAYLLQFWATYNRENRSRIPRLNALQAKYRSKGLVIIGQNCWEHDDAQVEPFLQQPGNQMVFAVALDDKTEMRRGKMAETWMVGAGVDTVGWCQAFLVDTQGLIAWMGEPTHLPDSLLEAVLDGTFDAKQAGDRAAAEAELREQNMRHAYDLWLELSEAKLAGDWETAEQKLTEMERLEPPGKPRTMLLMEKRNLFMQMKDFKRMHLVVAELSDANQDDAMFQNLLAWQLLVDEDIRERDPDLAEKIAKRADAAAEGKDPLVLDTLARALFMNQKPQQAIKVQQQAVGLATEGELKAGLQATLDSYKQGKLPPPDPRSSTKLQW